MRRRPLGRTGLEVSEIGFGCWGIGGVHRGAVSYGPVDDAVSERALRRALDRGINFFDTADLYGHGHSEEILGQVFRRDRDRVVLATKVGLLNAAGDQDFSAAHIRRAVEGSLKRLRTDYIDLYQLHNPPVATMAPDDPALLELERLRREGRVRAVGLSVRTPADGLLALERFAPAVVQVNFNLIDQRAREIGLLQACATGGVGVIVRTPLCYGFLTGKYSTLPDFDAGDHRTSWSDAQLKVWADAPTVFEQIRARTNGTAGQLALRYCLAYGAVSTVIPGMLTPEQVEENTAAAGAAQLDAREVSTIEAIYKGQTFFLGAGAVRRPTSPA